MAASADGDGLGTGTGMGDFQWTVYDEDAANARGFGGANARRFDPDLDITLCGPGCTVDGPLVRVVFEHALDARREELAACAADLPSGGDIVLVLDVAPDGHVTTATATGLAAAAPCITDLARHLAFPHDVAATHARIPIHFAAR